MADAQRYPVYTGLWTNWSYGRILGSTLTLSTRDGTLLVAFIAYFVTFVGTRLWRIICFGVHHYLSAPAQPNDAIYHQRQAILRNTSSPSGTLISVIQLAWTWHKKGRHLWARVLPIILGTTIAACALVVASGFSAKVARDSEVLIDGANCGWVPSGSTSAAADETLLYPLTAKRLNIDSTYAQQCYSANTSSGSLGCNTYIRQALPYTVATNASCPFSAELCATQENVLVDTGFIDSHADLGWNAPESQRFEYRLQMHCAPLSQENFTSMRNGSNGRSFTEYFYGPSWSPDNSTKHTFMASNDVWDDRETLRGSGYYADYSINARAAAFMNGSLIDDPLYSDVVPLEALRVPTADLNLLFLTSSGMFFSAENTDPWFKATTHFTEVMLAGRNESNATAYRSDSPGSVMACLQRQQFCNLNLNGTRRCTDLAANADIGNEVMDVFPDESSFNRAAWFNQLWTTTPTLGHVAGSPLGLLARNGFQDGFQGPLPNYQWQLEVQNWFSIYLSSIQRAFVDAATGTGDTKLQPYVNRPNNTEEKQFCRSQKILSPYHMSFSVFALFFLFVLGVIIIVLAQTIDTMVLAMKRRRGADLGTSLEWSSNETLQLQRLAHEELHVGKWTQCTDAIPLTQGNVKLAVLDISDPMHPRLRKPNFTGLSESGTTASLELVKSPDSLAYSQGHSEKGDIKVVDRAVPDRKPVPPPSNLSHEHLETTQGQRSSDDEVQPMTDVYYSDGYYVRTGDDVEQTPSKSAETHEEFSRR